MLGAAERDKYHSSKIDTPYNIITSDQGEPHVHTTYLLNQWKSTVDRSLLDASFENASAIVEVASLSHQSTSVLSSPPLSKVGREHGVNSL